MMASDDPETEGIPRTLSSPSIIKAELVKRLNDDGLNPQCSDEDKLLYVWRLLQQTEKDLQFSITTEEKLRLSQAEEMEEVENYVEHIRNLSDERETLIQELETENEQLKAGIENFKQEGQAGCLEETVEMLTQQGLEEISNSPITEQIAFLLVERARLLDELEAEQHKSLNYSGIENQLDSSFIKNIEQERDELKLEHNKLLESVKTLTENQARVEELEKLVKSLEYERNNFAHEKKKLSEELSTEIDRLAQEKEKLSEGLSAEIERLAQEKFKLSEELSTEIDRFAQEKKDLSEQLLSKGTGLAEDGDVRKRLEEERDDLLEQLEKHRKAEEHQKLVHEEEITTLMEENDKCEEDLTDLRQKITGLEDELKEAKLKLVKSREEQEVIKVKEESVMQSAPLTTRPPSPARRDSDLALRKIIVEKTQIESEIMSLRSQIKPLENENNALQTKISELEAELQEGKMLAHTLQMKNKTLQNELLEKDNNDDTFQHKMECLSTDRDNLEKKIAEQNDSKERLKMEHKEVLNKLQEEFSEVSTQKSSLQSEFERKQNELNSLILELHVSKDNLTSEKEELLSKVADLTSNLETINSSKEQAVMVQTSKVEAVMGERQKLFSQLQDMQRELKEKGNRVVETEKQLAETSTRLEEIRCKLGESEQTSKGIQKELKEAQNREKQLVQEKDALEASLNSQNSRFSQDSEDLKSKLQMTLTELTKSRSSLDQLAQDRLSRDNQIVTLQNTIEDNKSDYDSTVDNLQSKIKSLEHQSKSLEEDLFASQEEQQKTQQQYEQTLKKLKSDRSSVETELNKELHNRLAREESLSQDKIKLEKIKIELQNSLEKNTSTVVGLQKTLDSVYKERDNLQLRVNSLEEALQQEKGEKLKQLESMQKERDSYKESMDSIQSSLQGDNQDKNKLISELRSERDQTKRDLDKLQKSLKYEGDERQQHLERMRSVEDLSKQLETDNRELAQQLSEKLTQCQHLDDQIRREKNRQIGQLSIELDMTDKLDKSHEEIQRLHLEIDSANDRIRQLREDAQNKQSHINKLEMEAVSQEAKHETAIHKLELTMNDLRLQHRKELDNYTERLEATQREARDLLHQLRDKDQEMIRCEHEASRAKTIAERLDTQLQTEIKHRAELENKNTVLEQDVSKVWTQVKSLMEKLNNLENSKKSLEDELDRKCNLSRESNDYHSKKLASQDTELTTLLSRADLAERKVEKLQSDLTEAIIQLQASEKQMFENSISRSGYQDKQGEITEMRRSLHDTHIQKTILEQTVHELNHQVSILKQRETKLLEQNRELQHLMIDMESKVNQMRERAQTANEKSENQPTEQREKSEYGKRGLGDQISRLRREVESLQTELITAHEKRDIWERRYEERKNRTKSKLLKAREFYTNERNKLKDQLVKLGDDLTMTRSTLNKELDWRTKMEDSHKTLLGEKRDLLTELAEREESCRDLTRQLSMLGVRLQHQDGENTRLQENVLSLTQQKQSLDKTVKDIQLDRHKEMLLRALSPDPHLQSLTAATSGLGNSMDSSWDPDHLAESGSRLPSMHHDNHSNGYFLHNLHHGRIEFSGSERSYDFHQEYDA